MSKLFVPSFASEQSSFFRFCKEILFAMRAVISTCDALPVCVTFSEFIVFRKKPRVELERQMFLKNFENYEVKEVLKSLS